MAKGFNKVILMGNLTRDVEMRTTTSGQTVANFSLAVSRSWKDRESLFVGVFPFVKSL